jgi:hypothetical protein
MAIPILLWLLPADFFDNGPPICLSQILLHRSCPGCGISRAVMHSMHLDFTTAWEFNKLVIIVLPVLFFIWAREIIKSYKQIKGLNNQV